MVAQAAPGGEGVSADGGLPAGADEVGGAEDDISDAGPHDGVAEPAVLDGVVDAVWGGVGVLGRDAVNDQGKVNVLVAVVDPEKEVETVAVTFSGWEAAGVALAAERVVDCDGLTNKVAVGVVEAVPEVVPLDDGSAAMIWSPNAIDHVDHAELEYL